MPPAQSMLADFMAHPLAFLGMVGAKGLAFLVIIFIIAVIHEFGHFIVCKLSGVRVDEFSVGVWKLLYEFKWGETVYSLRALPIAAYVRPAGMNQDEMYEEGYQDPGERSFMRKPSTIKHLILLAGPLFNILSTILVFAALYNLDGYPETTIEVKKVMKGSRAEEAGIREGDVFLDIDGIAIKRQHDGIKYISAHPEDAIRITVQRVKEGQKPPEEGTEEEKYDAMEKEILSIIVTPRREGPIGRIGISAGIHALTPAGNRLPLPQAMDAAVQETWEMVTEAYSQAITMLHKVFSQAAVPAEIGGPLSIAKVVGEQVERKSARDLVQIFALLSMAIGVFNLLPIPALDGGRMTVIIIRDLLDLIYITIFWKYPKKNPVHDRVEDLVHLVGMLFLLLLLIVVTFKDCREIFGGAKREPGAAASASPSPVLPLSGLDPSPGPSPSTRP